MKLQFDPNQPYQLDAVAAVMDLFDGQPQDAPEYAVIRAEDLGGLFAGQTRIELGVGNHLLLPEEKLHTNTCAVPARNDIEVAYPGAPLAVWELFDMAVNAARPDYNADGQRVQGKFARTFETARAELAQEERYQELDWLKLSIDRLHNGYSAQDKKGVLKDTRGDTQTDDEVYNLIMKDKECLLSLVGAYACRWIKAANAFSTQRMRFRGLCQ
jgi:restriction endonuclease